MNLIVRPDSTPLVTIRAVFRAGAANDPADAPGAAWMTNLMHASAGTSGMTYAEVLEALFPMGVHVWSNTDKELSAFTLQTHVDNLDAAYAIFRDLLLDPGWRDDDFERLREDSVNHLAVYLRGQNDEELAKAALVQTIFHGHAYGHANAGTVSSLQSMTVERLLEFARENYTRERLTLGLGGGLPAGFVERVERDFSTLPSSESAISPMPEAPPLEKNTALLVEKDARSVAMSLGFPIDVRRGHPDYPALLVAVSALGQHRQSSGRLFQSMRQHRGLNYGDYAYIEAFPSGMFTLEPEPNVARSRQLFDLWIRPVEPQHAHFALRLALHELEKLIEHGLTEVEFQRTRSFLSKYVNLLVRTRTEDLGYRIDSAFYGIPPYPEYLRTGLALLTLDDVNATVRRHLRVDRLAITAVGPEMAAFAEALASDAPSPITYASPKPDALLAEDRVVAVRPLGFELEGIRVLPVDEMFA